MSMAKDKKLAREREVVKGGVGRVYEAGEKAGPKSEIRKIMAKSKDD